MKSLKNWSFVMTLVCILYSVIAFASAVDLSAHGKDLMRSTFAMRYHFSKLYHTDWMKSTYEERREFLINWYQQQARAVKEAQAQAREEATLSRERARQKKEEERKEAAHIKARQQEAREQEKQVQDRDRDFKQLVRDEQRTLDQLRRQQQSSGR